MSYDPSRRALPPRQGGWPQATPPRAWPAYRDGSVNRVADQAAGQDEATGEGSYWADASSQPQPAYQGQSGYQRKLAYHGQPAYRAQPGYPPEPAYEAEPGYQGQPGYGAQPGYPPEPAYEAEPGYRVEPVYGVEPGYRAEPGYGVRPDYRGEPSYQDAFDGSDDHEYRDYRPTRVIDPLPAAPDGYAYGSGGHDYHSGVAGYYGEPADAFDDGGYGVATDGFDVDEAAGGGQRDWDYYAEPGASGAVLMAPDAGMLPHHWRADRDRRQDQRRRGVLVGAVTGFLSAAVVIGVTTLAAAIVRPPVSPVVAVGNVFIARTPAALRNLVMAHFGSHGRTALLLGMYIVIALLAMALGVLTRRAPALGVACVGAGAVVAAFVTITRPQSGPGEVIPWIIGGIAGAAALLWLVRSSAPSPSPAPATPVRPARGTARGTVRGTVRGTARGGNRRRA